MRNHIPRLERRTGGHLRCIEKSLIILVESTELRLDLIDHEDSRRAVLAVNDLRLNGLNTNGEQREGHELLRAG